MTWQTCTTSSVARNSKSWPNRSKNTTGTVSSSSSIPLVMSGKSVSRLHRRKTRKDDAVLLLTLLPGCGTPGWTQSPGRFASPGTVGRFPNMVPRHPGQQYAHAARVGGASEHQPGTDEGGQPDKGRMH